MKKLLWLSLVICMALLLLMPATAKKKAVEQFSSLSFVVLRESDGKPIKNASVVVHLLRKDGSQGEDGFQLKTDSDGQTSIDDIPYGRVRVQVIAPRLQTFGDDVEINQPKQEIVIRLKPPVSQTTIY